MAHFDDTPKFATSQGIAFGLKDAFQQARQRMSGILVQMQYARMVGVLNSMTDAQLAEVGIARAAIPQQAAYLVGLTQKHD